MREALEQFLTERRGIPTTVADLRRITVGHSRAMYRVTCGDGAAFVVRMEQGGVFGTSSAEEYGVMAALCAAGQPVARPRWNEPTGAVLGQPFFVMDFLEGAEGADERTLDEATAREFVRALRSLHDLDWVSAAVPFHEVPPSPAAATHVQIDRWAEVYRSASAVPIPLLDEAAAWLHRNAPPLDRLSVVHGDAGPGNFVHAGGRVVAITDFEFTHLGDPDEDWVFCVVMRGSRTMTREQWERLFAEQGVVVPPDRFRYWEAFNLFKGACANRTCLTLFENGANPAPNMAIIGTSLHQVFLRRLADLTA